MNEFNNRIEMQRKIIQLVNLKFPGREELFALSSKAIERWSNINLMPSEAPIVELLRSASMKLSFLANKSQEQVSEDYKAKAAEVSQIAESIKQALA